MSKNLIRALLIALVLTFATSATAKAPSFKLNLARGWAVAFQDGDTIELPATTRVMLGVVTPIADGFGWSAFAGVALPDSGIKPNPRVFTGPSFRLTDRLWLSTTVLYELKPPYVGDEWKHLFGVSLVPIVKISDFMTLNFLVGGGKLLGGPFSLAGQVELSFTLPL